MEVIDVLGNRKLRKLELDPKDLDRLPEKRYYTQLEYEEAAKERILAKHASESWLDKARTRKKHRDDIVVAPLIARRREPGQIKTSRYEVGGSHDSRVTSTVFRESSAGQPLLLYSTGGDKCIKFYHVNQATGADQVASVQVSKSPIWASCLSTDTNKIYFISDYANVFCLDIESKSLSKFPALKQQKDISFRSIAARDSNICLLEASGKIFHIDEKTRRTVRVFNSGSQNEALIFNPTQSTRILSGDSNGELFEWDLGKGRCVHRVNIPGTLGIVAMAETSDQRLLVGTNSGFVNLHTLSNDERAKPIKEFPNLVTASNIITAHPTKPFACIASNAALDSARLLNTSGKGFVYQNWPGKNPNLGRVTSAATREGWAVLGNDMGVVKLWRIWED